MTNGRVAIARTKQFQSMFDYRVRDTLQLNDITREMTISRESSSMNCARLNAEQIARRETSSSFIVRECPNDKQWR
jgi:hypothetical protein